MSWRCERVFEPILAAPQQARLFVAAELARVLTAPHTDLLDDVLLVLSELVTNAVQAGTGTLTVTVDLREDALRVAVADQAAGMPAAQPWSSSAPGGRGLMLVERLSTSWGVTSGGGGKQVWAELPAPGQGTFRDT